MKSICRSILGLVIAALAVGVIGIGATADAASKSDEVRAAIGKRNVELSAALAKGDAAGIAALYTKDAEILPPRQALVQGREGAQAMWAGAYEIMKGLDLTTREVDLQDDTAIEVGTYVAYGAAKEVIENGKYIVVWKRIDKQWYLHRDIWNSTP